MIPIFQFSNVVVVDKNMIGVIVKSWGDRIKGYDYDVYVRGYNSLVNYHEKEIKHFVYSKNLSYDELDFYTDE